MADEIEIGDHVTIGGGRVHWIVTSVGTPFESGRRIYHLKSGLSGRDRTEVIGPDTVQLHIHTKGSK